MVKNRQNNSIVKSQSNKGNLMFFLFQKHNLLFFVAFCCTVLSQTQWAIAAGLSGFLQASWVGIIISAFNIRQGGKILIPSILLIFLFLYCLFMSSFTTKPYLDILLLPRIPIVVLMLFIGLCLSRHINVIEFKRLLIISSVIGSVLLLYSLYSSKGTVIVSIEESRMNGAGKNTVAIIILTLVYTIYKLGKFPNIIIKSLFVLYVVISVAAMILLRCRTAVLTIPILLICEPIILKDKKALWTVIGIILSTAFCIFILFPDLGLFLTSDFIFNDSNTMQMNSMDDRYRYMEDGYQAFLENPLFGSGYLFVENFYLVNLFNLGIIGFVPLSLFLIWTVVSVFNTQNDEISSLNKMLFVLFFLNGVLEAESPFGPGTRCFLFWLLLGYSIGMRKNTRLKKVLNSCQLNH